LEVDHFQPRSIGGSDGLDNLVYCCSSCNRYKGDFWSASSSEAPWRLLRPGLDDLSHHLHEASDGQILALIARGAFHCERLRLNRVPLVELRRGRREVQMLRGRLTAIQAEQQELLCRIAHLEAALDALQQQLVRFLDREPFA
jgi:hypothetical protein